MPRRKWTSAEVVHALRIAYGVADSALVTDEWSFLTEVPLRGPNRGRYATLSGGRAVEGDHWSSNVRTIDVLLTRNWTSGIGHRRIAVEVKVSKSDYKNETDIKREPAECAAHQTFYAAPAGIIDPDTLPTGWGLYEVYPDADAWKAAKGWVVGDHGSNGSLVKCTVRPALRTPTCNLEYLVAAGMRRASRAEERIRRGEDDAAKVPALEAEAESLRLKLERREEAIYRDRDRLASLKRDLLAAVGDQECADCGEPIGLDTRSRYSGVSWKHRVAEAEVACHNARQEAERLRREAKTGAAYLRGGYAPPVEPKAMREQAADLPDDADTAVVGW